MMRQIREEEIKKPEDERNVYVPMTFESLISHLSYKILREDLEDKISEVITKLYTIFFMYVYRIMLKTKIMIK